MRELVVVITSGSLSPWLPPPSVPGAGAGVRVMAGVPGGPISGRRGAAGSVRKKLPSAELLRVFSHIDRSASEAVLFPPETIADPLAIVRAGKEGGSVRRRGGAEWGTEGKHLCLLVQDLCILPGQIPLLQEKGCFVTPGLMSLLHTIQASLPLIEAVLRLWDLGAGGQAEPLEASDKRLS